MAKGLMQTGTTLAQAGNFSTEKLTDGLWQVNGIRKFITQDDNEQPVFSTKFGEQLKVGFEWNVVGQTLGLACSLRPADFYATALLFGVDLKGVVTPKNRMSSAVIERIASEINKAGENGRSIMVAARNGWVNYVRDARPPEGLYTITLSDIRRPDRDESLEFQATEYGDKLLFEFDVVGDGTGRPCVWDGYAFVQNMYNPFVATAVVNGQTVTAEEAGQPLLENKDGFITRLSQRWQTFIVHFAPEVLEHDWVSDPVRSEYGINELQFPQRVIKEYAMQHQARKIVHFTMRSIGKKQRPDIDLLELDSLNPEEPVEDEPEQPAELLTLIQAIEKMQPGAFSNSDPASGEIVFSEVGRTWAKNTLKPMWTAAGLGDKTLPLHTLTQEQVVKLLAQFPAQETEDDGETWPS